MQSAIFNRHNLPARLSNGIFKDRRRQFIDRLQWDLCLTASGEEVDEYEDDKSECLGSTLVNSCLEAKVCDSFRPNNGWEDASGAIRHERSGMGIHQSCLAEQNARQEAGR